MTRRGIIYYEKKGITGGVSLYASYMRGVFVSGHVLWIYDEE